MTTTLVEKQISEGVVRAGAAALAVACRVAGEAEGWKFLALRNAETAARLTERANGRGMEIERLDKALSQMTILALSAEGDLAAARAENVHLGSQVRELGEQLDAAAADVLAARTAERAAVARAERLERALSDLQERAVNAETAVGVFEDVAAKALEAWDLAQLTTAPDELHRAMKLLRAIGRTR